MPNSYLRIVANALWRNGNRFDDPVGRQERLLRRLLRSAQDTEWGRDHDFRTLARAPDVIQAYQQRVPLTSYSDLQPHIERMRRGAANVLWPGKVHRFGVSSGTVSNGKVLPASDEALRAKALCSSSVGLNYMIAGGRWSLLRGKVLTLPGRVERDPEYPGTVVGETSALFSQQTPAFFRRFRQAVPNDALLWTDWEEKLQAVATRTLSMDVRALVTVPSWAPVLFEMLREAHREKHGRFPSSLREIWPNLQVIFSGGVALSSYRELLEKQFGAVDFIESYAATEGFFAFQTHPSDEDLLLHLDSGVFYEFVRVEELGTENPRRYTVADVEPGVRYALFVSTNGGLWAYGVRDVVRFTRTFPHRLVVAGRTAEMMDRYGEALFAEEARAALERTCQATQATVREYHIAPRLLTDDALPGHQWFVEFAHPPDDASAFTRVLDEELCATNRHYGIRRETGALEAPEVVAVPPGTFYQWLKTSQENISAQTKVPRMADDRAVAEQLALFVDEAAAT